MSRRGRLSASGKGGASGNSRGPQPSSPSLTGVQARGSGAVPVLFCQRPIRSSGSNVSFIAVRSFPTSATAAAVYLLERTHGFCLFVESGRRRPYTVKNCSLRRVVRPSGLGDAGHTERCSACYQAGPLRFVGGWLPPPTGRELHPHPLPLDRRVASCAPVVAGRTGRPNPVPVSGVLSLCGDVRRPVRLPPNCWAPAVKAQGRPGGAPSSVG